MNKTRWFSADVAPIRSGWYECNRLEGARRVIRLLEWNGNVWKYGEDSGRNRPGEQAKMVDSNFDKWRGIEPGLLWQSNS